MSDTSKHHLTWDSTDLFDSQPYWGLILTNEQKENLWRKQIESGGIALYKNLAV